MTRVIVGTWWKVRRAGAVLGAFVGVACGGGSGVPAAEEADGSGADAAVAAPAPASVEQESPLQVELVGQGVVSLPGRNETFPAVDPVDGALWFSTYTQGFDAQTLWRAPVEGDAWAAGAVAPFSGTHGDRAPRFSTDGARLYFTSNRPLPGEAEPGDMNVWVVDRQGAGWGQPRPVAAPVNSDARDIHVALSARAAWIPSARPGGMGRSDLYRVPFADGAGASADPAAATTFGPAEHVPAPLNSPLSQPDLWVAPDESWLVLAVTDHPDGPGGDDLFVSRAGSGGWSAPVLLPAPVNTPEYEYGPTVSPDGRWLYFTSHRDGGDAQIYRVALDGVRAVR